MLFIRRSFVLGHSLLVVLLLAGCGQSGALFLPAPAEVIEPASSPTAETLITPEAEPSAEN